MSVTNTHAPSAANRWLIAFPMPFAAPLTMATLPDRRFIQASAGRPFR